jgi:hypothetical protein
VLGAGQPEFGVDVDNVKPTGLVVGAALIMLALGKPLTGSRAFGGALFSLPQMGDCKAMVRPSRKGIWYGHSNMANACLQRGA